MVTRSGGPSAGPITRVAADASDPATGSPNWRPERRPLFNCANPGDYTTWEQVWPPLAASLLTAAERTGATLVITGNLYPYGPTPRPRWSRASPIAPPTTRAGSGRDMWAEALARHRAGRITAVEVRGADYLGTGVGGNGHISRHVATRAGARRPR